MNPINDSVNNTTVFIRNIEIKLLLTFLLSILFGLNCFAQEVEKLPEMPWENIAEMNLTPGLEKTNCCPSLIM